MTYIGYIVSKTSIKTKLDFIKVVNDISLVEEGKPCLIIGLSEAKKYASDNFSILRKNLGNHVFWTFGRTEKREEYEKDLNDFYNYIIDNIFKNIKYIYLNLININYNILKKLIKLFNSLEKKYIYIQNNMVYVLCKDNQVVGFSLEITDFLGIQKRKIIGEISSNKSNIICSENDCICKTLKNRLKHKQYVVPYIMSLME